MGKDWKPRFLLLFRAIFVRFTYTSCPVVNCLTMQKIRSSQYTKPYPGIHVECHEAAGGKGGIQGGFLECWQ